MVNKKKINAAIIIVGNEILSGRTQDTNTGTISLWLNSIGVVVEEVRVIPDIEKIIVETVNHLRKVYDYVFTTGGIGPTHDDITAKSISSTLIVPANSRLRSFFMTSLRRWRHSFKARSN